MAKLAASSLLEILAALSIIGISMLLFFQTMNTLFKLKVDEETHLRIGIEEDPKRAEKQELKVVIIDSDTLIWLD